MIREGQNPPVRRSIRNIFFNS